jgi:hypothetical protein
MGGSDFQHPPENYFYRRFFLMAMFVVDILAGVVSRLGWHDAADAKNGAEVKVKLGRGGGGGGEDEISRARTQISTSKTGNTPPALIYETDRHTVPYVSACFFRCS